MILDFDDFDIKDRLYAIEEKTEKLKIKIENLSDEEKKAFIDISAQAYIFHDSALEGLVVSADEISSVFSADTEGQYIRSRVLQEIRNHRKKIYDIIEESIKFRYSNSMYRSQEIKYEDIIKIHEELYEGAMRKCPGKLRTIAGVHMNYFHELVKPKQIKEKLIELCDKAADPEFRTQHPLNQAVLFHFNFMQIFPFVEGSGKVGRLYMNNFLLQGGYELAIIHSSERQLYYETLRDSVEDLRLLVIDSIESAIDSRINFLQENNLARSIQKTILRKKQNAFFIYSY